MECLRFRSAEGLLGRRCPWPLQVTGAASPASIGGAQAMMGARLTQVARSTQLPQVVIGSIQAQRSGQCPQAAGQTGMHGRSRTSFWAEPGSSQRSEPRLGCHRALSYPLEHLGMAARAPTGLSSSSQGAREGVQSRMRGGFFSSLAIPLMADHTAQRCWRVRPSQPSSGTRMAGLAAAVGQLLHGARGGREGLLAAGTEHQQQSPKAKEDRPGLPPSCWIRSRVIRSHGVV